MSYTLKELIQEIKKYDINYNANTVISVYITSIGNDSKRHTVIVNPDSDKFMDRMAMIAFDDCTVSDTSYRILHTDEEKVEQIAIIIVDLDKHYDNATYDKWWRK
jgi:hypothetical protein